MDISEKELKRFSDPEYSVLEFEGKRIFFKAFKIYFLIWIGIPFIVIAINGMKSLNYIRMLKDTKNVEKLTELAKGKYDLMYHKIFSILALVDLDVKEIAHYIDIALLTPSVYKNKAVRVALQRTLKFMAVKYKYKSVEEMLNSIEKPEKEFGKNFCEFCGSKLPKDALKCPECFAPVRK